MKKILIIEDDKIIASIYRNKLVTEGFQVEVAEDGVAGQAMVASFKPDLVILDLMLPRVNGVEVIKQIRADAALKKLPILVFSNSYLANVVQDAWKAGASRCLSKSDCNPKLLISVVQKLLVDAAPPQSPATPPTEPPALFSAAVPAPAPMEPDAIAAELRQNFTREAPKNIGALRALLQSVAKADPAGKVGALNEVYLKSRWLTSNAALAGYTKLAQISSAFEAFLKELNDKPDSVNASTLRTLAHTVDFLAQLTEHAGAVEVVNVAPPGILVVDDEIISRRAVVYALEKAGLKSIHLEDPNAALATLSENRIDLVLLDVDMPGMSGFDLCQKLRALPQHKKTPVIFVTSMTDFESRAKSTLSGGNDLIAKPFLFMELAVKALTYILKSRLDSVRS